MEAALEENNALDPFQSGFRPCDGMEMTLVNLHDDLLRELDRGKVSLLILLNVSAAFDTVDHGVLLGRLSELVIGGLVMYWLQSFLEGCPQRVQLGEISTPWTSTAECPRGQSSAHCCLTSISDHWEVIQRL